MRRSAFFAIPGDLDSPTGGYAYARRLIAESDALGAPLHVLRLPGGFPEADEGARAGTDRIFAALPDGAVVLADGLAFGALDDLARREGERLRLVALVHHPLALESGLDAERAARLRASEIAALARARAVVATSRTTAALLAAEFGVAEKRMVVAPPGTDPGPPAAVGADVGHVPPRIVSVGSLIPRKGHDLLIEALARLSDRSWSCVIAGSLDLAPDWADSLAARVRELGLDGRIAFLGARSDVRRIMAESDLFVLPTRLEGYGMAFAEALSQGLPVVGTTAGAVPEVVPEQAGILVPADDPDALTAALAAMLDDPALLRRYAAGARAAGALLPSWRQTAEIVLRVLQEAAA